MKVSKKAKLIKKVQNMELNNPIIQTLIGLVVFYIGLKMFSGGMKSMGNIDHLQWFLGNPIYMFFGGIIMTLLWQSSSLSTTAIIGLVAGGALPLPAAIGAVLGAAEVVTQGGFDNVVMDWREATNVVMDRREATTFLNAAAAGGPYFSISCYSGN